MPTTNYPTALDDGTSLPNPGAADQLNSGTTNLIHHNQHDIMNDAIKALEAKAGVTRSTVTNTLDYLVNNIPVVWSALQTYSSGVLVLGSDGNEYRSLVASNLNNDPTTDGGTNWEAYYFHSNVTLQTGTTGSGQRFTDGGSGIKVALAFIKNAFWSIGTTSVTIQTSTTMNVTETTPIDVTHPCGAALNILGNTTTPTNCVITGGSQSKSIQYKEYGS